MIKNVKQNACLWQKMKLWSAKTTISGQPVSAGTLSLELEAQFGTEGGSSSKLELEDMVGAKFHSSHDALADDH